MDQFISHDIFAEPETSSNTFFIKSCRISFPVHQGVHCSRFHKEAVIFIPNQVGKMKTIKSHQVTPPSPTLMLDIWRNRKRNTTWTWQSTLPSAVGLTCWVWVLSRVFFSTRKRCRKVETWLAAARQIDHSSNNQTLAISSDNAGGQTGLPKYLDLFSSVNFYGVYPW